MDVQNIIYNLKFLFKTLFKSRSFSFYDVKNLLINFGKCMLKNITFENLWLLGTYWIKLCILCTITYSTWITLKVLLKHPPNSLKTLLNRTYYQPWKILNIHYKILASKHALTCVLRDFSIFWVKINILHLL